MYYLIDDSKKIIFGWTPKCGCTHIKNIFWYLQNGTIGNSIHHICPGMPLPKDTENYTILLFSRNPYKRLVSGFLHKYSSDGTCRSEWKKKIITFSDFVDELTRNNWDVINRHHFYPQTAAYFDKNEISKSKNVRVFDIEKIDYKYIESLYEKQIPEEVLNRKNERKKIVTNFQGKVYDMHMDVYENYNIPFENFYNKKILDKVYKYYKDDFIYFGYTGSLNTISNSNTNTENNKNMPVRNMPVRNMHIRNMPIRNMPVRNMPVRNMPVRNMPVRNMPIRNMPVRNMPVRNMPVRNMHIKQNVMNYKFLNNL